MYTFFLEKGTSVKEEIMETEQSREEKENVVIKGGSTLRKARIYLTFITR